MIAPSTKAMAIQLIVDDAVMQQRACNRQHHAHFARPDAAARCGRRTQPLEGEDKQHSRDEVGDLDDVF